MSDVKLNLLLKDLENINNNDPSVRAAGVRLIKCLIAAIPAYEPEPEDPFDAVVWSERQEIADSMQAAIDKALEKYGE